MSRDPIGERGGVNLYCFVGNNPIINADKYGLLDLTRDDILRTRDRVDSYVRTFKCCCDERFTFRATLSGMAIFSAVMLNVDVKTTGCVTINDYYWWDCATGQEDYNNSGPHPASDPNSAFQDYGWRSGGTRNGGDHEGGAHNNADADHWNWRVLVLYTYCGHGYLHVGLGDTGGEQFTWNLLEQKWEGPTNGNVGGGPKN